MRDVRVQEYGQARRQQVLRGPSILAALVDGYIRRGPVHGPMAERRLRVYDAVSERHRLAPGQDFQPVHRCRVDNRPNFRYQRTRHQSTVSIYHIYFIKPINLSVCTWLA